MLKPARVEEYLAWAEPRYQPAEHGGLISYVEMSGMPFSTYAYDPSGIQMMGVQRHDCYDFDNLRTQNVPTSRIINDIFEDRIRLIVRGEITTNFIHPDAEGNIAAGTTAYAGPSGLFTHDSSFGGDIVGIFLSEITGGSQSVMVEGDIFKRTEVVHNDDGTYQLMTLGYPRKSVTTPGYAKLRLKFH